jgi:hypothetical protein
VQYGLDRPGTNVTVMLARPTRGVFQVDGWGELNVMVVYGAVTGQISGSTHAGEWRVFGLGYRDNRDSVLKTDNRQLEGRLADTESIDLATFGGHTLYAVETAAGAIDLLAWGAVQTGSWGELAQRGGAFSVEAGWQPNVLDAIQPWIRGGWQYGSGDHDPADTTHGTFFQVLPTPRVYARFPFFNMMNVSDVFGELRIRPSRALTIRSDVHVLHLADPNDLWYQGGGAFQTSTFGYTGRPSSGQPNLATLYDLSGDITVGPHVSIGAYLSYAAARPVTQAIYDSASGARFGYVELSVRF